MLLPSIKLKVIRTRFRLFYLLTLISLVILISSLFLLTVNVYSAQITLTWDPNSEEDLAGYKVYYGNSKIRSHRIENLSNVF